MRWEKNVEGRMVKKPDGAEIKKAIQTREEVTRVGIV